MELTGEELAVDFLRQVKEILDKNNVEFWLDCGTLLGAVRDGKFISWDCKDIDLGAWDDSISENVKANVFKAFCKAGFNVIYSPIYIGIIRGEIAIDFTFYHLDIDKAVRSYSPPKNLIGKLLGFLSIALSHHYCNGIGFTHGQPFIKRLAKISLIKISRILPSTLSKRLAEILLAVNKRVGLKKALWVIPSTYFQQLKTITFYEMTFKVPAKAEDYLAYRYGKDWRIPKKGWVTIRDDGTVIKPSE